MEQKVKIYTPEDCKEKMFTQLKKGRVKGTTTHNKQIDACWTWRKQEANIFTGYANEGKSLFLKQLCLIKALQEDWKFLFCSPEDFPPEDFFDDMIHTITGRTTDKDYPECIPEELYEQAFNLIKNNFIFVYIEPPNNTIKGVLEEFKKICDTQHVDCCVIDPLLKFARPKDFSERDDIYASYVGGLCIDFCRKTNTVLHLIMHQLTPHIEAGMKKYPEPNMYRVKGGGSWSDGFDNVLSVWRPDYAYDKFSTDVIFGSQKIKKQKLVGIPQKIQISFNRKTNRYTEHGTGVPLFDFDKFIKPVTYNKGIVKSSKL